MACYEEEKALAESTGVSGKRCFEWSFLTEKKRITLSKYAKYIPPVDHGAEGATQPDIPISTFKKPLSSLDCEYFDNDVNAPTI